MSGQLSSGLNAGGKRVRVDSDSDLPSKRVKYASPEALSGSEGFDSALAACEREYATSLAKVAKYERDYMSTCADLKHLDWMCARILDKGQKTSGFDELLGEDEYYDNLSDMLTDCERIYADALAHLSDGEKRYAVATAYVSYCEKTYNRAYGKKVKFNLSRNEQTFVEKDADKSDGDQTRKHMKSCEVCSNIFYINLDIFKATEMEVDPECAQYTTFRTSWFKKAQKNGTDFKIVLDKIDRKLRYLRCDTHNSFIHYIHRDFF
jgi:hypothetical protein